MILSSLHYITSKLLLYYLKILIKLIFNYSMVFINVTQLLFYYPMILSTLLFYYPMILCRLLVHYPMVLSKLLLYYLKILIKLLFYYSASSGILKKVNIDKNNSSMKQMPTNACFDSECNELRKTINTYAQRSNLTHTENNNYYHNVCNNYKRMIQRKKRNYNTNLKVNLEEMCSNNSKDYWGFWKRLERQNISESTIELYQFYNCFLKQSEPPTGQNTNTKFKTIQQKIPIDRYNYDISNDILNGKIQLDEVEKALGRIRKGKASGIDGIPIELYSSDIKYVTPLLTTLFNTIFDLADYPDDWTQGLIYPVHKKGDKSDPQNYRKVSLISSLAKVFESVLENRLSFKQLVCRDDDPLQRGFNKDCRTSDNLFVLYNLVETQKTRKKPLYVCYIDLTKAFDYLNRDALILKLQQRNEYNQIYVS